MKADAVTFAPGPTPNTVRAADGRVLTAPEGWILLAPGDAALTRRVKAAGEHWVVAERKGRKIFSRGIWTAAANVERIRADLERERSTEAFAKKKQADSRRRDKAQAEYVEDFCGAVIAFLRFDERYRELAERLARAVTEHTTPVGSGTVARTKRIPVERRAEAAVIAWMRHQTTGYDSLVVPRVKGKRREIRRMFAARSHQLLERYRRGESIPDDCPLKRALSRVAYESRGMVAKTGGSMLPSNYRIRLLEPSDYEAIVEICKQVYPTERPYTLEELGDHHQVFPQGQFVAIDGVGGAVAGVHFTLRLRMNDFHIDDSWDVLTSGGTFLDHNPDGPTLYGADIMVHPSHQHHGIAHALTDEARFLVQHERLWRMVGASRIPGYGRHRETMSVAQYVEAVIAGTIFDPVLTIHLKDGWSIVRPIHGYLQHDEDSVGWAVVIQWVNPDCPPPAEFDLRKLTAAAGR